MCSLPSQCRSLINDWVKSATDGKIVDLLPPGSVISNTVLVLANAITFKGYWQHAFTGGTRRERFYHSSTRYVNMMHMTSRAPSLRYAYVSSIKSEVVELPFYDSRIAMYIVLPRNYHYSLSYVESRFSWNPDSLGLTSRSVQVSLPKFTVKKSTKMSNLLKALGMTDLFSENKAKLGNIAGRNDIWVADVFHQAYINVHEKGTEASAATAVVINIRFSPSQDIVKFVANRPFLFFIWDRETKSLLFNGRFTG